VCGCDGTIRRNATHGCKCHNIRVPSIGPGLRTGLPAGMLAAAARCYLQARNTGPETPYRSSVLTVHEQQR